jgi:hypothetical protein
VLYIADFLEAAGYMASTARESPGGDSRPDIAVWIDELHTTVGNPLAIGVVACEGRIGSAVVQLQRKLRELHSPLGLLVTWRQPDQIRVFGEQAEPIVVVMSVRELVEAIGHGDLARVLLDPRNALIHSAA